MIIENQMLAWFGAAGTLCDAVGGVYLTYDLLGGHRGPLGFITRMMTYGIIYGLVSGLAMGPFFGMVYGVGLGMILSLEFWRVARYQRLYQSSPLYNLPYFGIARGLVLGFATIHRFGLNFGLMFGLFNALGLYIVYALHFSPTYDYRSETRLRLTRHILTAGALRGVAIGISGALTGWLQSGNFHSTAFGLTIGLLVGVISVTISFVSPAIEWWVANLREQYLGVFGFILIFMGLVLQSVQYAVVILGVSTR